MLDNNNNKIIKLVCSLWV